MFQLFQRPTCPLLRDSSDRKYTLLNFESIPILQIHIRSARTEAHGGTGEIAAESAPPSDALRSSVLFHTPPVRTAISLSIPKRTRKPFLRAVTPQRDACRSPCRNETPDATPNHAETAERRRIKADASRVSGRGTVPDGR